MQTMIADWGTDHWYETDGYFNQNQGPWLTAQHRPQRPTPAGHSAGGRALWARAEDVPVDPDAYAHAHAAWTSMNSTDPQAVWFYQGW